MSDTYADLEEMECKNLYTHTTVLHTTVTYLPTPGSLDLLYDVVTVMDARKMEFIPDQCFDLIIDKGISTTTLTTLKYFPPFLYCYRCILYVYLSMLHSSLRRRPVL